MHLWKYFKPGSNCVVLTIPAYPTLPDTELTSKVTWLQYQRFQQDYSINILIFAYFKLTLRCCCMGKDQYITGRIVLRKLYLLCLWLPDILLLKGKFHTITEWFGLEGTLNLSSCFNPLPWAELPSSRPGCSKPHPRVVFLLVSHFLPLLITISSLFPCFWVTPTKPEAFLATSTHNTAVNTIHSQLSSLWLLHFYCSLAFLYGHDQDGERETS